MQKRILHILVVLTMLLSIPATIFAQGGDILEPGDSVTATAAGEDVEFFIVLSAGDSVEIDLQSSAFDTFLRIEDASGAELAENDDFEGSTNRSNLTFEAPADGEYTIVVTGFFGSPEGEFTLEVVGDASTPAGDDGKGSSSAGEGDIAVGDSITEDASGNVEYTIVLESGQTVTIDVVSDDFDAYLDVLDEDGEVIDSDDDGGDGFNSSLEFTAPAAGTYTLLIRSFAGQADGEFTISVDGDSAGSGGGSTSGLEYGQTITVDPDGEISTIIPFEGEAGDVINLYAIADGDEDSRIYLYGPDGEEVAQDDDSGEGSNPYIRRLELPETGTYEIDLQGFGENPLTDSFDVTLELTELLEISADAITVSLGESLDREVLVFEAVDDTAYLVSVEAEEDLESSLFIDLLQEDEFFAATRFTVSGASSFAAIFTADETGRVIVELEYFGFSGDVDVSIAIEPIK